MTQIMPCIKIHAHEPTAISAFTLEVRFFVLLLDKTTIGFVVNGKKDPSIENTAPAHPAIQQRGITSNPTRKPSAINLTSAVAADKQERWMDDGSSSARRGTRANAGWLWLPAHVTINRSSRHSTPSVR